MAIFENWLNKTLNESGAASGCCISLKNESLLDSLGKHSLQYLDWLKQGLAGEMHYLEKMKDAKSQVDSVLPGAESVIVITFTNHWGNQDAWHHFPKPKDDNLIGYISAYAKEYDYHKIGHEILGKLHKQLENFYDEEIETSLCVDTKPVFERFFAHFGGLGVLGPNDLLRTEQNDVRCFIGLLFIKKKLPEILRTPQMPFPCKTCIGCVKACPTGAISNNGSFDARKCSSYLSIEHRGVLDNQQVEWLDDWLFGCDWCTVKCPPADKIDTRIPVDLEWLLKSPAAEIRKVIKGTAIDYAGVTQLRKNAVIILAKSSYPKAHELLHWVKENSNSAKILEQIQSVLKGDAG